MKKTLLHISSYLCACLMLFASLYAQAPQSLSYQSVVRDGDGILLKEQTVGLQISIIQGDPSGTVVYSETHMSSTNTNGLLSVEIGTGNTSDLFSAIDWSNGPYFIGTAVDPAGGMDYTITGTSQLLSVPYALHANVADSVVGGVGISPSNEPADGNLISYDGTNWVAKNISVETGLTGGGLAHENRMPFLTINYCIALEGIFPSRNFTPFVGQIATFGFEWAPRGWARCDGQLLAINQYAALFSLIGTIYGGDGRTTFGLPDLRGRAAIHSGNGPGLSSYNIGQRGGLETVNLSVAELPRHSHTVIIQ